MGITSQLLVRRYKSTEEANAKLSRLAQATSWRDDLLSRLAIARSLREPAAPPRVEAARKGKELRGETLFRYGHETQQRHGAQQRHDSQPRRDPAILPWFVALLAEHHGKALQSDEEAFDLILAHWHRGLDLLVTDLDEAKGVVEFIVSLARKAADTAVGATGQGTQPRDVIPALAGHVPGLTVPIGRFKEGEAPFTLTLNDARKHSNCHLAVSGMSGSGKTQLAMQLAASALRAADPATGMIFIDFAKGDVASNQAFVETVGAKVFNLPSTTLPIGPFHLRDYSQDAVVLAAEEKREVYTNLFRNLGPKQEGRLVQAIRTSYKMLAEDPIPAPDFGFVFTVLRDIYEAEGLQPDSLIELFRRLNAYKLFWTRAENSPPISPLHTQRWIVDIHELGGLKEVTAFTLIEQLYHEMRILPESTVDPQSGFRHVRCLLFIDEAQYYLSKKNRFLQGIIREGRSKGFAVVLLCQSPDDFDQSDFDYTEQLEFTFMLACKTEPKAVQRLLGCSPPEARRLATELGKMEPLSGLGRGSGGRDQPIKKFRVVPFFELFPAGRT
ncbi:MAG: DndE family protein [Planctomycetes bacterium]|nr:DndE family protein [Planctomycetota bacterium]